MKGIPEEGRGGKGRREGKERERGFFTWVRK